MKVGDEGRFDGQSDIYRRRYKIVELEANGNAKIELLPIEDDVLERMILDKYTSDEMILDDIARTGTIMPIRFVSHDEWAKHF